MQRTYQVLFVLCAVFVLVLLRLSLASSSPTIFVMNAETGKLDDFLTGREYVADVYRVTRIHT